MKAKEEFEELKRLPKYRNMSFGAENEFYNDLMRKMEREYCRWYGSAYNLYHRDVVKLRDDIFTGKTTFAKWKKELADANIRANMGLGPNDPIPPIKKKVSVLALEVKIRKMLSSIDEQTRNSTEFLVMMRGIIEDFGLNR